MSEIKIIEYGPEWEEKHQKFARTYFFGRRKRINPDYIYWKFRGEEGKPLNSFLLAISDGEVIGQLGLLPADVRIKNKLYNAQWACDLMVSNQYRGTGVAKLLYDRAVLSKITLGSDPSPAASISMLKFGFLPLKGPSKVFFSLTFSAIANKKAKALSKFIGFIPNPFVLTFKLRKKDYNFNKLRVTKNEDINFELINTFNSKNGPSINRDLAFFEWRLKTFKDYQSNAEVFTDNKSFFLILKKSNDLALVGDFVYKDLQSAKNALVSAIDYLRTNGIKELKLMISDPQLLTWTMRNGFLKYKQPTTVIYFSKDQDFNAMVHQYNNFNYTYIDSDENI